MVILKLLTKAVGGMPSSTFLTLFHSQKKKFTKKKRKNFIIVILYYILIKDSIRQRIIDHIVITSGVYMTMATKVFFMHSSLVVADLRCLVCMLFFDKCCLVYILFQCLGSFYVLAMSLWLGTYLLLWWELNYCNFFFLWGSQL